MSRNYSRPIAYKARYEGEHAYYGPDTSSANYIGSIEKGDGRNLWNISLSAEYGEASETFYGKKLAAAERLEKMRAEYVADCIANLPSDED